MPSLKKMTPRWVKTSARRLIWPYRRTAWRSRSLPDFMIIGAQKSGTSSLYTHLGQHPQLLPSYKNEVHFFDNIDNFEKGQAWYRAHFPFRKNVSAHSRTFEASPLYIFNPLTPRRIFDLVPEVKLIAVLRNPTERAISHYFHQKRKGRESMPIKEALQEEEKPWEFLIDNKDYKKDILIHHLYKSRAYKSRGLYKQQIERYLNYFPWQQILVLSSEEFFSEPDNTLRQVFQFVGVDTGFKVKDLKPRNVANNKSEVDRDVYSYLNNYFLPHNQALYELVGKRYGW